MRRIDRILKAQVRKLCGAKKGLSEGFEERLLRG